MSDPERRLRRDLSEDFAEDPYAEEYDQYTPSRQRGGVRLRLGGMPKGRWGWIVAGVLLLLCLAVCAGAAMMARDFLLHDERFIIPSSSSIEFEGNQHVTRADLLNVFGGDVERNIFRVPLADRRLELEQMPWVAHATVMRLLPDRLRVSIVERTPAAFVREGNHIGLVDANGVLLDMPVETKSDTHYSFPVVTGISTSDPLSTRAARMKIFTRFTADLDSSGERISQGLSEVDLSNPEDVKALIPDHSADILVHFGETDFLDRYRRFREHLPEWRTVYPKLSSVDMRYERQVVLEMQPGSGVPMTSSTNAAGANSGGDASQRVAAATPAGPQKPGIHSATQTAAQRHAGHGAAVKPKPPVHAKPQHKAVSAAAKKKAAAAKRHAFSAPRHHTVVGGSASNPPLYHPPQVVHP